MGLGSMLGEGQGGVERLEIVDAAAAGKVSSKPIADSDEISGGDRPFLRPS